MKVECVTQELKEALLLVDRISGKNLSLPVLSQTLFLVSDRGITLRATNLDIGVETTIPAKVFKEGVIAVPGSVLGNYLSLLTKEKKVVLELVGQNLTITSDTRSTVVKCSPYEDFPSIPLINKGDHFSIDVHQFVNGMRSVIFSASSSDIKPEFASIHMFQDSGYLVFVSTDSSRLAEKKISVKKIDEQLSILLPAKNSIEIIRLLENTSGTVDVFANKSQISFINKDLHITSRLVDGMFPDYKQIIPKNIISEAVVLKEDLLNTLKIVNIFSGKLQQVRMVIDPKEKILEFGSRNDDVGETMNQVESTLKGERVDLLFNQRFLLDVLQIIPQDSVSIQSAGSGKPLIVRGIGDQTYLYLVMPMRVV